MADEPTIEPVPEPPVVPTVAPTATRAPVSVASALRQTTSATFLIGNTQGRGMPMRPAPIPTERGKLWPDGTTMLGLGGEREAYGWTWAWVQDPDGTSGWMPNNFLIPAAGSPSGVGAEAVPTLVPAPAELPTAARPHTVSPTTGAPSSAGSLAASGSAMTAGMAPTNGALPTVGAPATIGAPKPSQLPNAKPDSDGTAPSTTARPLTVTKEAMIVNGDTVVVSGRSTIKTRPFALTGGSYTVAWQGAPTAIGGGSCVASLAAVDSSQSHLFLNVILEARERSETQIYGVKAGQYYLDMKCGVWSVAIVPQGQDAQAALDTAP